MAEKKPSQATGTKPKRKRKRLSEAMVVALIGFAGTIIAGILGSPLIGGQVDVISESQLTLGPTPTFTLHPDAVGPIQTLTSLANAVDNLEQSGMTHSINQTLTSIASTIDVLGQIATKAAETPIPTEVTIPSAQIFNPLLVFDQHLNNDYSNCWQNETTEPLLLFDGFGRRNDGNWRFGISKGRAADQLVRTDFSNCLNNKQAGAIAVNAWVERLEVQRDSPDQPGVIEHGREFGIFVESANGQRRDYIVWVDKDTQMHFQVRENDQVILDEIILVVNDNTLKISRLFPRLYSTFPIQIFYEINNQGLDIIYLKQGSIQMPTSLEDINPAQMIRIDDAVLPTLGNTKKIGLIGYGGETQIIIWPLVFYGK